MSVNLSEVLTRAIDRGGDADRIDGLLRRLRLEIVGFDDGLALAAAKLRGATRHIGASLGDRACLALAIEVRLPVLTVDRAWAGLDLDLDIRMIR